MEPTLVVIGISFRTAALAVRERFWMDEPRRLDAISRLIRSEGIDEVIVISNCNRTEFYVWTQNATEAANSVLRFLTRCYDLKLSEWSSFYRLVDDAALEHALRVACALDAAILGDPEYMPSMIQAWREAQKASATGHFLDAVMHKALSVAMRVTQTSPEVGKVVTVAAAARQLALENLSSIRKPKIVIIGAGKMAEAAARELRDAGFGHIVILNRTYCRAKCLADQLGMQALHFEELYHQVLTADLVITATSGHGLLTRSELAAVMNERREKRLVIIDVGVPRNVDPSSRAVSMVTLYDMDDLCEAADQPRERVASIEKGEFVVREEVDGFHRKLLAENLLPTLAALRARLEQICEQEVEKVGEEFGPFTEDQAAALRALGSHITQRLAATLARQLRETPGKDEQGPLTSAIQELFQLEIRKGAAEKAAVD